jgi:hypothetical protein
VDGTRAKAELPSTSLAGQVDVKITKAVVAVEAEPF